MNEPWSTAHAGHQNFGLSKISNPMVPMIFQCDPSLSLRVTLMELPCRLPIVKLQTIIAWMVLQFVCFCFSDIHANAQSGTVVEAIQANQPISATTDGTLRGFEDLLETDGQAVCFAFLYPGCPLAQEYAPVLQKLADEFAPQGMRFVGVICECDDPADVEAYRAKFGITFPILLDREFTLAAALGATVTPEVVLVDRMRSIRYAGRIDDRYKIRGVMTPGDSEPELANAIADLIAGRTIREPRTKAAGCPLDRPERPTSVPEVANKAKEAPTYFRDILPFFHAQCQKCHSPNQAGPFPLLTYDDAVEWVDIAIEEIEARRMPPAQIESDLEFRWTKPPTAVDVAMLHAWVAAGKPQGIETDAPQLPPLPDYSAFQEDLGPPDIILEQPEPTQLGAYGNDVYRTLVVPLNRSDDLQLRAIQFLPGNRKVVHHSLIGHFPRESANEAVRNHGGREGFGHPDDKAGGFQDPHGLGFRVPPIRDDGQPRAAFVTGFVPGVRATVAPDDAAVVIPAGCDMAFQMHYVRTGKLETDSSRIGLWLAKNQPSKVTNMIYVTGDFGVVPPGVHDLRIKGSWTLPKDADFVGVVPHMHQLGRWLELKAFPPGAEPLLLLRVPQWDYNWQSLYDLKEPRRFPAGTRFEVECSYDNSDENPRNPSTPPRNVWHDETIYDEMLLPMLTFASERPIDSEGKSFFKFYCSIQRSRFLKRIVNHRHKYIVDPNGEVILSPDYVPDKIGE